MTEKIVRTGEENDPDRYTYFTLRDRFAMAALTGLTSITNISCSGEDVFSTVAEAAYLFADAMLEERNKK